MTITPAYDRDYTSKKAVLADLAADKDFVVADMFSPDNGRYVNRQELIGKTVQIRYKKLTQVCVVTVK